MSTTRRKTDFAKNTLIKKKIAGVLKGFQLFLFSKKFSLKRNIVFLHNGARYQVCQMFQNIKLSFGRIKHCFIIPPIAMAFLHINTQIHAFFGRDFPLSAIFLCLGQKESPFLQPLCDSCRRKSAAIPAHLFLNC